ncbi:hypothetical protein J4732_18620, partial [Serratia marcescens]|nr:hypothetical protein [Serratia marcescens]
MQRGELNVAAAAVSRQPCCLTGSRDRTLTGDRAGCWRMGDGETLNREWQRRGGTGSRAGFRR